MSYVSDKTEKVNQLSSSQRVLLALDEAVNKLETFERAKREPIAIIGMGCRFPGGANTPDAFWQLLREGMNGITEVPSSRWDVEAYYDSNPDAIGKMYSRHGGFLTNIDKFDAHFFGMAPRVAAIADPQQRLLLQVSWEALEDAGQVHERRAGSQTGVFIGVTGNDYARLLLKNGVSKIDANYLTGNPLNTLAGRLSYLFGFQGPSLAVDTACSSSLVAVHLACQSLRNRECTQALAGGVNLILSPEGSMALCRAKMLAHDGRCKTFDASADGFVRAEGCGMIVLKRLSDAQANRDNILALIRGSAVNHNGGNSSSLIAPSRASQETVIRNSLENGGVEPAQVSYIEVQGTGTALGGEPIEVKALSSVYGKNRSLNQPLVLGSVKTNIGHAESAAGIAGLIKVVLSLQHQEIPAHLHLKELNPNINWDLLPIEIPTQRRLWSSKGKRFAAVNSYGASGTNAHIVLEESPLQKSISVSPQTERPLHVLTLSAKTDEALKNLAQQYKKHITDYPNLALENVCFTANTGRLHFQHRLSIIVHSCPQLREKLSAFLAGQEVLGIFQGQVPSINQPKIGFLFTDQDSPWVGKGSQLYATQPLFRQTLDHCAEILGSYLEKPLLSFLFPELSGTSPLNEPTYGQPALFALEYALFQLWKSWGIEPSIAMGYGVGEYLAACVAGVFSLEDGLKLIVQRGRLFSVLSQQNNVKQFDVPQSAEVSAVESMVEQLEQVAKTVTYSHPNIPLVANDTGELATADIATARYWCNDLRQTVAKLPTTLETIEQRGIDILLELSPQPIFKDMSRQHLPKWQVLWLPSLDPEQDDWQQLLQSLGSLYVKGAKIDWSRFDKDYPRQRLQLPTYPWKQQRCWFDSHEKGQQTVKSLSQNNGHPSLVNLLNQGNIAELTKQLEMTEEFSKEELQLLPKLLQLLVKQDHQQPREIANGVSSTRLEEREKLPSLLSLTPLSLTPEGIQNWLVNRIAKELGVKPDDLDIREPFDSYGLDSVLAISIASAGTQFFGVEISPYLLLHYPTIESLSQYLSDELQLSESEILEI
ncbi:MAG: beta-ketoacyl synthase N-terminal-like domain-containing protein [Cyanobacteria bacterium P01_G01_bin.67]